ncbi:PASTA domain-containing protein [Nocardioides sp.]|uniref:PASTA domain-containing protein n=1 Tax=Nocardioides sp. TaxID=35761 RepID=UPI001A1B3BAD|nr:PASTA domain-containing protein [Nocardioides sp.]MBJ7359779.1 PASTA domain-containing protein [Nocardioides sp.]
MRVAVVVLSLLLVGGCSDASPPTARPAPESSPPEPSPSEPSTSATPGPSTPPSTSPPRPRSARVPWVVGQSIPVARAALAEKGFEADVRAVEYSACVKPRVLRQDPPRGSRRETGSTVRLDVTKHGLGPCGLDLPAAEPALDAAGRAFVDFARGGPPDLHLLDNPVALYLGGTLLHSIPPQRAVHRLSYGWLCPNYGYYSARVCPFSAVRAIASFPGPMAVTGRPPTPPCGGGRFLEGRFPRTVTLTPDEGRSCVDYFAVELALDGGGRLEAVNLVWSEP